MDDEHSEIKIVASEEEHKLITTNADELLKLQAEEATQRQLGPKSEPQQFVKVRIDTSKPIYKRRSLNLPDIKYLVTKKYTEVKQLGISGKKEAYLIKPRANETIEHCFLVFDIADYLKKLTNRVELFETTKPDIVFELNGQAYAVEIETGKTLETKKKQIEEKTQQNNLDYGNRWCYVVTNENCAPAYNVFARTFTRTTFAKQFSKWLEKSQNFPIPAFSSTSPKKHNNEGYTAFSDSVNTHSASLRASRRYAPVQSMKGGDPPHATRNTTSRGVKRDGN